MGHARTSRKHSQTHESLECHLISRGYKMASTTTNITAMLNPLLLNITGAIYKLGEDRPISRWSFIVSGQSLENTPISSIKQNIRKNHGIEDRVKELGIKDFRIKLQHRKLTPDPEFPKGRVYAIDSQDQWMVAFPLLCRKECELIGIKIISCIMHVYIIYVIMCNDSFVSGPQ